MLSAVVLTKNEEENIKNCLEALLFCDEIIVVDDYSTDNTCNIASKIGTVIFKRSLNGDFASQRNFGLSKAKNLWVLFVDADEIVTEELKLEIISKVNDPLNQNIGYFIKRKTFFMGKQLRFGEAGKNRVLRLAKKSAGKWERKVHEFWKVEGKIDILKNELNHFTCRNLDDFIGKINFYSELHAKSLLEEKKHSNLFKIIFYPPLKFFNNFFLK
ncbi:MAG: glycosyltransferase family 2 protein, partial [Microgenomates group bacterium]